MAKDGQTRLGPPSRTSIDDPGAHDLDSDDSDDHFSDARSGFDHSGLTSPAAPIPITRVEKVDNEPSYGEVPGTLAHAKRTEDAQPDEIAVIRERDQLETPQRTGTPGGHPIPTTMVEKIDPSSPSHGEVPGTIAHEKRAADAVPDMVVRSGESKSSSGGRSRAESTPGDLPIPITRVERVDSSPSHGEVPGTLAHEKRAADAVPDIMEEVPDAPRSPTGARSTNVSHARRKSSGAGKKVISTPQHDYNEDEDGDDDEGFGDDFDNFEEGEEDAGFEDFEDGFQEAPKTPLPPQSMPVSPLPITPAFPVLDFGSLTGPPESILSATTPHLNALFPPDTIETSILPPLPSTQNPIFLSPRSASLWSQLVAPPPLQPPNWIRSRIRRLFLVSLGVPVDLDEILPASKQKKLILPSIHLNPSSGGGASGSPRTSTDSRSISRLKSGDGNTSSTSVDSQGKPSRSDSSRRRRGPAPPPHLDLVAARQLCNVTEAALDGLTIEELKEHLGKLEAMVSVSNEVLEYWTKRTDEKLGDREAFEGVIENLVKHARKVRK